MIIARRLPCSAPGGRSGCATQKWRSRDAPGRAANVRERLPARAQRSRDVTQAHRSLTFAALPDVLLRYDSLDWPMLRGISHFCVAHPQDVLVLTLATYRCRILPQDVQNGNPGSPHIGYRPRARAGVLS